MWNLMGFHLTWDFTYEISFVKGFVLFHIDLSISFALFSWEFGDVFKTIILFLFFIWNIFLRRIVDTMLVRVCFVSLCWKATINLILGISSGVSFSFLFCHYMMYTLFDNAAQKYFNSFHCVFLVFHVKNQSIDFLPPDKVEELILYGKSISVCFKKSQFFIWNFFDFMWNFLKTFLWNLMDFHETWDFSYEINFYERVCFISYGSCLFQIRDMVRVYGGLLAMVGVTTRQVLRFDSFTL